MTRLDAGAAEVRRESFDLVPTVRDALAARGWRSVTVDGPPGLDLVSDPRRVVAVVTNLVGNALRHGAPPVSVGVSAVDGAAMVEVRDAGPGVPAGDEERVFDRFAKAQEARSRGGGGERVWGWRSRGTTRGCWAAAWTIGGTARPPSSARGSPGRFEPCAWR
ncbi:sensor histidine kinase KdpD [Tsukamurella sp. PLM1]|uniref:sensor histidine kinase n=1 Tax=Tsukamurella sp. PLM1 TaxID=2929795 RepID=UPI0020493245|nr:HAMP domain-containing sensor histidine kinase [Tsukamurella sp. PLM1]BDH55143.1 hypothetical protein MTP03_00820 [Tsukamurella sp. PLM1]